MALPALRILGDVQLVVRGDARALPLKDGSVQCVVTSPPYWGLRAYVGLPDSIWGGDSLCDHRFGDEQRAERRPYSVEFANGINTGGMGAAKFQGASVSQGAFCRCGAWRGQLGLEPTIEMFVDHIVQVFREVRRVMRDDAVCFMNIGDSYWSDAAKGGSGTFNGRNGRGEEYARTARASEDSNGLKPKDLCLIPFRVALALQRDGWWVRSDIIFAKMACMPESVEDRPTRSHEFIFLLTKSANYYYDATAIREPHAESSMARYEYGLHMSKNPNAIKGSLQDRAQAGIGHAERMGDFVNPAGRNKRDVWTLSSRPNRWALCKTCRYVSDRWPECRLCGGRDALEVRAATGDENDWNPGGPNSRFHRSFDPAHPAEADGKERRDEPEVKECARCGGQRICPQCGGRDTTAHFASFPSSLPELCILAGTSEKGCCSNCGSPYERVEEVSPMEIRRSARRDEMGMDYATGMLASGTVTKLREARTTGWRPACDCEGASVVPCLILDPFGGSGTSAEVADRLGRRWVMLEMSPDYVDIIRARTRQRSLFTWRESTQLKRADDLGTITTTEEANNGGE